MPTVRPLAKSSKPLTRIKVGSIPHRELVDRALKAREERRSGKTAKTPQTTINITELRLSLMQSRRNIDLDSYKAISLGFVRKFSSGTTKEINDFITRNQHYAEYFVLETLNTIYNVHLDSLGPTKVIELRNHIEVANYIKDVLGLNGYESWIQELRKKLY